MNKKAVVLLSGGVDSATCLALAVKEFGASNVLALCMYYGQKHDIEIHCAHQLAKYYRVQFMEHDVSEVFKFSNCTLVGKDRDIPTGTYKEQATKRKKGEEISTYVPFRNGLFLSCAASIALSINASEVFYGAHANDAVDNVYPDCTPEFFICIREAVCAGTNDKVVLRAPFIHSTKSDIVAEGIRLGVPYELTWSCYQGGSKPCGKCGTCLDRAKAFADNHIKDPAVY